MQVLKDENKSVEPVEKVYVDKEQKTKEELREKIKKLKRIKKQYRKLGLNW